MRVDPKFVENLYAAKRRQRAALATLPIEEKIARLVKLQERAREIHRAMGRKGPIVWKVPSASSTSL